MSRLPRRAALLLALSIGALAAAGEPARKPDYPPTRRGDVVDTMHGQAIADPYRWLEENEAPEVVRWDEAQQALTRAALDAVPGREALRGRIHAELDLPEPRSLPSFDGGRMWYRQKAAGRNHAVLYARERDGEGEARAVLDPNAWSAEGTEGLGRTFPSPDGRWLAYLRASRGSEDSTLYLRDLEKGADDALEIPRAKHASVAWAPDASGFWYTRQPDPDSVPEGQEELHRRVFFHPLGGLVLDDERVYGAGRPDIESMEVFPSFDRASAFLNRGRPYVNDDFFALTREGGKSLAKPIFVGAPAVSFVDRMGDRYLLLTDWKAPRRRLLATPVAGPFEPEKWATIVPEGAGVLESFAIAGDLLVLHVREDVVSRLRVVRPDGADAGEIALPGPGSVGDVATKPGDPRVWFSFDSYDRPETTYVCDASSRERRLVEVERAATTIDVSRLVTERFDYPSKDGTKIPLFVLRRRDVPLDAKAPTLLYGYGGFRIAQRPRWSGPAALWADEGGVYCVACLRGGDEFGEDWHLGGCLERKQNVFDDFIAAADWLVSTGKAARDRLAIRGGSNGGLLVAVVANQRPDLCRAVVCNVPLTDMLRFHRFRFAKTWTEEYGNPDDARCFAWIRPYSPYHNVKPGTAYPAALLTAGLNDGRVDAFHARKLVAAWQHATSSDRPILLSIDRKSGHGSASRLQAKEEILDRHCFLRWQLGAP